MRVKKLEDLSYARSRVVRQIPVAICPGTAQISSLLMFLTVAGYPFNAGVALLRLGAAMTVGYLPVVTTGSTFTGLDSIVLFFKGSL